MFSLIITIISIALVAVLALATLYYGGSAFNKGSAGAEASRLINAGQQINGAVALYKADKGGVVTGKTLADLVTEGYLAAMPVGFDSTTAMDVAGASAVTTAAVANEVCTEVNTRANGNGVFSCDTTSHIFSFKL